MFAVTVVALLLAVASSVRGGDVPAAADVGESLMRLLDIQTIGNDTDVKVPGYMYELYRNAENRRYDVIRSISPETESIGAYIQFVYDLNGLKPTEIVQKAVLQVEPPRPNYKFSHAINVSFYSFAKNTGLRMYLGSANIRNTLDLTNILGSHSVTDFNKLVVKTKGPIKLSIGLVLYSNTTTNRYDRGHELATLLFETTNKRRRRSVADNEIDDRHKHFTDELKRKNKKKKKKKKGSKTNRLQAIDVGTSIVFTNSDQCRMEKLVLNFEDIGWEDWVIFPKGFETNYCAGSCLFPLGKDSKPTNHATVQSLARSFGRLWDIPEPSCVPDTLAPLSLLYLDRSNHVLLKSYPDMKVLTCSCK